MFGPRRRAAFVLVSTDHGSMIVNQLDWESVGDGKAIGVSVELFNFSSYDDANLELLCKVLEIRRETHGDGAVVIDGGANIGCYALALARLMTGWGSVIAYEPQQWIYYALCGNLAINNCFNAIAHCAALGRCASVVEMPQIDYRQPRNFGGVRPASEVRILERDVGPTVPLCAIDDMALPRLDLLKLDIEGMELEALEGAKATIERCKPMLSIEHIHCGMEGLERFLHPLGYTVQMTGMNVLALHKEDPVASRIRWYDSEAA